jgi:hypothetical protein
VHLATGGRTLCGLQAKDSTAESGDAALVKRSTCASCRTKASTIIAAAAAEVEARRATAIEPPLDEKEFLARAEQVVEKLNYRGFLVLLLVAGATAAISLSASVALVIFACLMRLIWLGLRGWI